MDCHEKLEKLKNELASQPKELKSGLVSLGKVSKSLAKELGINYKEYKPRENPGGGKGNNMPKPTLEDKLDKFIESQTKFNESQMKTNDKVDKFIESQMKFNESQMKVNKNMDERLANMDERLAQVEKNQIKTDERLSNLEGPSR